MSTEAGAEVSLQVVSLEAVGRADVALAGGKGANLGELMRAGIPVPPGFVVSAAAYRGFLRAQGLEEAIAASREALADAERRGPAAAALRKAIVEGPMSGALTESIVEAYAALGGGRVAVRSSGTAEDLPGASFAGQYESYLNVEGAGDVVAAVRRCWASLLTERAVAYRQRAGFADAGVDAIVPSYGSFL